MANRKLRTRTNEGSEVVMGLSRSDKMRKACAIVDQTLNGRRRFGRRSVTTLRLSFQFMAQTALKRHLILNDNNSLD